MNHFVQAFEATNLKNKPEDNFFCQRNLSSKRQRLVSCRQLPFQLLSPSTVKKSNPVNAG
jgi:hypothetical protein